MTQDRLKNLLNQDKPIQRGKPLGLSTTETSESAPSHLRTIAPTVKRTKRGYALRDDLVKECKQIALDTDRLLYEVMEACLTFALAHQDEIKAALEEGKP